MVYNLHILNLSVCRFVGVGLFELFLVYYILVIFISKTYHDLLSFLILFYLFYYCTWYVESKYFIDCFLYLMKDES
jgi:hypothetical protein